MSDGQFSWEQIRLHNMQGPLQNDNMEHLADKFLFQLQDNDNRAFNSARGSEAQGSVRLHKPHTSVAAAHAE